MGSGVSRSKIHAVGDNVHHEHVHHGRHDARDRYIVQNYNVGQHKHGIITIPKRSEGESHNAMIGQFVSQIEQYIDEGENGEIRDDMKKHVRIFRKAC